MKIKEIREKNSKEIEKNLADLRNKLAKIRFDISGKQVKNHREARQIKKDIARMMTVTNLKKSPKR